jgi:hypothetical protein
MSIYSANTFGNSNRTGSNSALTEEQLKKAEADLLRRTLGWEYKNINTTNTAKVQLLQGDKDYHFLFNFLPDTQQYRHNLNINYEGSDLNKVLEQSSAKLNAAKEYYLEKAKELQDFWQDVMPTREQYADLVHIHHAKMFRLQRIVGLLNKEINFNTEVTKTISTKNLTNEQEELIKESYKRMDEQRTIAQQNYLQDRIEDFRIPFFASDMPAADARIQKEMYLIKDVVLKDLNTKFYEAYNETIENHISHQILAKTTHESNQPELSKLHGYMSQFGLNLKLKFLDVMNDKLEHGTITQESLDESLEYFNNNYGAMQDRLFPAMEQAIRNGATFTGLMETKTDALSNGFTGLKDEFDHIYNGLISHAEGKKTIADLMREKAYKTTDLRTDGVVDAFETAQNVISSRRATHVYDRNYDLDNDGDVDSTDIAALNTVLKSKNSQFDIYNSAYDKIDTSKNGLINSSEAESMLTGYLDAARTKNLGHDLNSDGVVNGHDLNIIRNIIKADLGVDFDTSGDNDTVVRNILNFVQKQAERRNEIWDMQDGKLEEYYESAGETYGVRIQYYYRFLMTQYADGHQAMGGAYIDSMLAHIATNTSWLNNHDSERNIEFNDRLVKLNAALDNSVEVHKKAATKGNANNYWGSYDSWENNVEARVLDSLGIQKERAATYGLFYTDADDNTTAQVDKLFDLLEVTYADYYNNSHRWDWTVNEGNSLKDIAERNPNKEYHKDASDIAISTLRSVSTLIYSSRYRAVELTAEQDNMYNETLKEYINDYVGFREKLQSGEINIKSPEAEALQDRMEAKYDLLLNLGNKESSSVKAVAFADTDGDGVISSAERTKAHNDFDYGMKMQQILHTNDLGISEDGQNYLNQYDFNSDGLLNEHDYDILDNVVGIANEFPIHNLMNIINKQEKVVKFVDARIRLENKPDSKMPAISAFLHSEIDFDQSIKENYWKTAFSNNLNFKNAYENIEKLRIQIMDAIEDGEDTSGLISQLNSQKASISSNATYDPKTEVTVGYLKFLDELEDKSGVLVNKFLTEQEFFTPEVREALEYVKTSSINTQTLIGLLIENPENFIEVVGYLKAAERLNLTDNFDQILSGGLGTKQINFLKAIGKFTESREFIANQAQNELFIDKIVDKIFGSGELNTSELEDEYSDYADLMVKYASDINQTEITTGAQSIVNSMVSTLYNSSTIKNITTDTSAPKKIDFSASGLRRSPGSSGNSGGGNQGNINTATFYQNIQKVFDSEKIDSVSDLKSRDELISSLNLSQEGSAANKAIMREYMNRQVTELNEAIEQKTLEQINLGNDRYNQFTARNIAKKINELKAQLVEKTKLMVLFN